jgi:hypothetical protein
MRSRKSLISPLGLVLLFVFTIGMGFSMWRNSGQAFSPGELSTKTRTGVRLAGFQSHAEFEKECYLCHQPLITTQTELCVACHKSVERQVVQERGVHGKIQKVSRCYECHSDHHGPDFDPLLDAMDDFDHNLTTFTLIKHQVDYDTSLMQCRSCHVIGKEISMSTKKCSDCHISHDPEFMTQHLEDFGPECLDCHDGGDRMAAFDHSNTAFPLIGKHAAIRCTDCHEKGNFKGTPLECVDCHAEPLVHLGFFGVSCDHCHTSQSWKPALLDGQEFDHSMQTSFSLEHHTKDYTGKAVSCQGCHMDDLGYFDISTCESCHRDHDTDFMARHETQFGTNCLDCHDGVDRMTNFDHATFFPLVGQHAEIECEACHLEEETGKVFKGTPKECVQCHAEPDIHAGFFGLECQYCHTASAWNPARLQIHPFPLDHGEQGDLDCQVCHTNTYTDYTCYGCHDHQPQAIAESHSKAKISLEELPACTKCHPDGKTAKDGEDG